MNMLQWLKSTWFERKNIGEANKSCEILAFLPAALEIQETPPNPLVRWLSISLISLFLITIIWACVGKVNVVATAEGKIIPSNRVKQIQPLSKSVVTKIHVSEGDYVVQGQALIELDATITNAEELRLTREFDSANLDLAVYEQLLHLVKNNSSHNKAKSLNKPNQSVQVDNIDAENYNQLLAQQWQQFQSQHGSFGSALKRNRAEQASIKEIIQKLEKTLPLVEKRRNIAKTLTQNNYFSEMDYLTLQQQYIEQEQDLATEIQRGLQLAATHAEITQKLEAFEAESQSRFLTKIAELRREVSGLTQELAKARDINSRQVLYAPVDGQVQQLEVSTIGGVVTDAQQLMLIVPKNSLLEAEVFLENKDIGFVDEGMSAEIKIQTFPFTKYGVVNAKISKMSDDAIVDEQRGLIYSMQLLMGKDSIIVNGKEVKLIPGMAVTAEVQIGKRRIIEFFLQPLLQHGQESLRER